MVTRQPHTLKIEGSIPSPATMNNPTGGAPAGGMQLEVHFSGFSTTQEAPVSLLGEGAPSSERSGEHPAAVNLAFFLRRK